MSLPPSLTPADSHFLPASRGIAILGACANASLLKQLRCRACLCWWSAFSEASASAAAFAFAPLQIEQKNAARRLLATVPTGLLLASVTSSLTAFCPHPFLSTRPLLCRPTFLSRLRNTIAHLVNTLPPLLHFCFLGSSLTAVRIRPAKKKKPLSACHSQLPFPLSTPSADVGNVTSGLCRHRLRDAGPEHAQHYCRRPRCGAGWDDRVGDRPRQRRGGVCERT